MTRGKTIEIYLPNGNPEGVRVSELKSSIERGILIPRSELNSNLDFLGKNLVGVYFLFGSGDDDSLEAYVGKAEDVIVRIRNHLGDNSWDVAVAFISSKGNINGGHIGFLESHICEIVDKSKRCVLKNKNKPSKPSLTPSDRDLAMDFFDNLKILLDTFGHTILEEIKKEKRLIYHCQSKKAKARGQYTEKGFVVLKDSTAVATIAPSNSESSRKLREKLIKQEVLSKEGEELYVFKTNYPFKSPSAASDIVTGGSTNGWDYWKTIDGKSLSDMERKVVEENQEKEQREME